MKKEPIFIVDDLSGEYPGDQQYKEKMEHLEKVLFDNYKIAKSAQATLEEIDRLREVMEFEKEDLEKLSAHVDDENCRLEDEANRQLSLQVQLDGMLIKLREANKTHFQVIDEVILLLELNEKPEEIIKKLCEMRTELDIKW